VRCRVRVRRACGRSGGPENRSGPARTQGRDDPAEPGPRGPRAGHAVPRPVDDDDLRLREGRRFHHRRHLGADHENEAVTHTYSDSEALALLKDDGWQRLLRLPLEPGTYRLQAEFTGHFFDAKPNDPPTRGKVETLFEKGLTELDLVLPVSRNTRLDKPGLSEISRIETRKVRPSRTSGCRSRSVSSPASPKVNAGTLNDPRYRTALFLKNDGRFLSALTELLHIEQAASDPAALPATFRLLQADCFVGFGMEAQAEKIYEQIAAGDSDPVTAGRAQITLAQFEYQRGYLAQAVERLNRIRPKLPSSLVEDWRLQMTGALLAQERYNEAIAMLTDKDGAADDDLAPVLRLQPRGRADPRRPRRRRRRQLNQVGTMDVTTLDMLVLRDKANLTLGYQYLMGQEGKNAKAVFGRIRTNGPFSNARCSASAGPRSRRWKAEGRRPLDGSGRQEHVGLARHAAAAGLRRSAGPRAPADRRTSRSRDCREEQQGLMRALVPWAELVKRDSMDPAVQEGMLAIPGRSTGCWRSKNRWRRYTDAIAALETARKRMDQAMASIKGGRMVSTIVRRDIDSERGWLWRLRDLPDAPETYFLQSVLAETASRKR